MTNKQIMIDGVPVQDCCYFDYENDGYEDSCYVYQNECSAQNCYYKQLKRKEQECDELKKGLNLILTVQKNCKECPHQELDVDVLVCDLNCATAFKKIAKQTLKKLENKNV